MQMFGLQPSYGSAAKILDDRTRMTAVGIFGISCRPEFVMRATVDTRLIGRLGTRTERSEHSRAYGMRDVHHAFSPNECASIFF
jgi:hypothetical protein